MKTKPFISSLELMYPRPYEYESEEKARLRSKLGIEVAQRKVIGPKREKQ
jgi:hypothetical protein